ELGVVIGVPSRLGEPVPVDHALDHVFGLVLVNDWSARDIQAWEYQPLGPFLGKSFATSIGHWVLPLAALADRRVRAAPRAPEPLELPGGATRTFLEDGDEVVLRSADLGEVRARIEPAAPSGR